MVRTIRFHLDEHVSTAVALGLRLRGVDVTTTYDTGLEHFQFHFDGCWLAGRASDGNGIRRSRVRLTKRHDELEDALSGTTDPEQLTFANLERRMIFTEDGDYLKLASLGIEHCGIAYCRQNTRSIGEIVNGLVLIWELCEPEEMRNRVEFI